MKIFLAISAILAWIFGAALLAATQQFVEPMHIQLTPAIAVLAQAQGAILLGLGVINFKVRNFPHEYVRPVLAGNLIVQLLSLAVITRALAVGAVPRQNFQAIVIHVLLGSGFSYFLLRKPSTDAASFAKG
jgi:hypothetical protein